MDEQVNAIVDNVAKKLGVAVEKLQPIAETILADSVRIGWANLCSSAVIVACVLAMGVALWRTGKRQDDPDAGMFFRALGFIAGSVGVIIAVVEWHWSVVHIVAPTTCVLKTLL